MAGTGARPAISANITWISFAPITFTVFTDTCTMTGDLVSAAAESTASMVTQSTMLNAPTP